jgi:phage terminase Nu1 subunit (DNA packaging protein)
MTAVSPRSVRNCLAFEEEFLHMKTTTSSILILAIVGALGTAAASAAPIPGAQGQASTPAHITPAAPRADELRVAMRKLWEDHIVYTRNYIISALADLPDKDDVAKRLLANQDEIGAAIKPYYGAAAGDKLATLLRDHITIATEVVAAAKAGDQAQLTKAQAKWTANGKDIAAFLSGANPSWSRQKLEAMLQKHLDLTTGEVVGRLNKDWAADIRSYDEGHVHMLMFADMLTTGIAKQFPAKVGR